MGNSAVWSLTGDYGLKITQVRGQLHPSELSEIGIVPTLHPAALMRGTGSFRQWKEDIAYAQDLASGRDVARFRTPTITDVSKELEGEQLFPTVMQFLKQYTQFSADIETEGLRFLEPGAYVLDIGFEPLENGVATGKSFRFDPEWLKSPELHNFLEDPELSFIWHNGKFDVQWLRHHYDIQARVDEDTMLLSYTRDEMAGVHDLDTVANDVLNAPNHKPMIDQYLPNKRAGYSNIPQHVRTIYLGYDVSKTGQIFEALRPRIADDPDLEKLYTKTLLPASKMLTKVERRGMMLDMEVLNRNSEDYQERINESVRTIQDIAGKSVNPNSPQQVGQLLYEDMKLPNKAKGSTAIDVLEKLPQVPVVKALMNHRKIAKAFGTYVKAMYDHRMPDGRVHPTYLIHGTRTGRLSSRQPNMQNIPRDPVLRGQFCAAPGYLLLDADLSQAELRALAVMSGDPDLCHIFSTDVDLHTEVARYLFKIPADKEPTKEQRVLAKTVNFGIVYGRSGKTIAEEFGMTTQQGTAYVQGWFDRFPVAAEFIGKCRAAPRKLQTITTCFGRKKRPGLVTRENLRDLQNEAANFPEQSVASDITLHTAIRRIDTLREDFDTHIVNLVHDSIVMEVPNDMSIVREVALMLRDTFAQVPRDWGLTLVPFESDAKIGTHWGRLEDLELEAT